jgi:hypothetical protein
LVVGAGADITPDSAGIDGVIEDGGPAGAPPAPLGPSAGTTEVSGTSSSFTPAAKHGAENASIATAATRAITRAERKSR